MPFITVCSSGFVARVLGSAAVAPALVGGWGFLQLREEGVAFWTLQAAPGFGFGQESWGGQDAGQGRLSLDTVHQPEPDWLHL